LDAANRKIIERQTIVFSQLSYLCAEKVRFPYYRVTSHFYLPINAQGPDSPDLAQSARIKSRQVEQTAGLRNSTMWA
jgi:hypothetical protein